eukprot:11896780-Heterocapsa_arctica.AAC.1
MRPSSRLACNRASAHGWPVKPQAWPTRDIGRLQKCLMLDVLVLSVFASTYMPLSMNGSDRTP